jgi:hypothetical protein
MKIKIMLYADEEHIAQVNLNSEDKVLKQDVKELLESAIPEDKIKEILNNIIKSKYEKSNNIL